MREEAVEFVENRRRRMPEDYTEASFERHVKQMMPKWRTILTPKDLAVCAQLRWESWPDENPPKNSVPTDVIVWCQGEPANRALTKIGGLPYWPINREWPNNGKPMVFVGQFNFGDSTDILMALPGQILSIFVKEDDLYDPEHFHFEWLNESDGALIQQTPTSGWWGNKPVFGQKFRTWDSAEHGTYQSTKIGGLRHLIQDELGLPGKHLATLHSLNFYGGKPDPFANRETPLSEDEDRGYFCIGDVGSLYIFIGEDGVVRAENASY
ncbi:MAG: DUF1963 domain-containing protein [Planctomycetes bacterium]|nr:DUF1963 domain-containing protein [Planctomycetota bacterium]